MKTSGHYLFHEEQSFRQTWILIPVVMGFLTASLLLGFGLYQQLYLGKPWGDQPMSDTGLIITTIVTMLALILVILLLLNLTLITEVRNDGFYYRFPILINRQKMIGKEDIMNFEVGKYNPIREFGGWGIRIRLRRARAYNVKGSLGVRFYLRNGKIVLFGTQQPEELKRALDKMINPPRI